VLRSHRHRSVGSAVLADGVGRACQYVRAPPPAAARERERAGIAPTTRTCRATERKQYSAPYVLHHRVPCLPCRVMLSAGQPPSPAPSAVPVPRLRLPHGHPRCARALCSKPDRLSSRAVRAHGGWQGSRQIDALVAYSTRAPAPRSRSLDWRPDGVIRESALAHWVHVRARRRYDDDGRVP
jgi:hypothetical protein